MRQHPATRVVEPVHLPNSVDNVFTMENFRHRDLTLDMAVDAAQGLLDILIGRHHYNEMGYNIYH